MKIVICTRTSFVSGYAPRAMLDLTRMGTQSFVFQAPVAAEPVTCPILSVVVFSPF